MFLKTIFLLLLSTLSISCSKNDAAQDLQSVLNEFKTEPQVFFASSDSVITIKGKKGTVLKINPKDLISPSNKPIDKIRVELVELTSISDLLKNNVQTVSNGKWLISGGSFKIEIFSDNEKLKLKENSSILASFPKIRDDKMELFYGERDENETINWNKANEVFVPKKRWSSISTYYELPDERNNRKYRITSGYFTQKLAVENLGNIDFSTYTKIATERKIDSTIIRNDSVIGIIGYYLNEEELKKIKENNEIYTGYFKNLELENNIYESIEIKKLGWINVDRFYPDNDQVNTLEIVDNSAFEATQVYILDKANNTVLNLFKDSNGSYNIDLPTNTLFTVIAFAIKDQQVFVFKKAVRLNEDRNLKIEFKKINKDAFPEFFNAI